MDREQNRRNSSLLKKNSLVLQNIVISLTNNR